jgi:hypothetical protein
MDGGMMRLSCQFCGEPLAENGTDHYFERKEKCFLIEISQLKEIVAELKVVVEDQEFDNRFENHSHKNLYIRNNNPY